MLSRLEFARDPDALFAHVEACWREAGAGRPLAERKDISAARLGRALPFVSLIDVVPGEPMDFKYRLIGQHIVANTGQNLTGKRALELPPSTPAGRPIYAAYVKCATASEPVRLDLDILNMNGTKRRMQALMLPLGKAGHPPDTLLVAAYFHDWV